jgi:hypothetical protein
MHKTECHRIAHFSIYILDIIRMERDYEKAWVTLLKSEIISGELA